MVRITLDLLHKKSEHNETGYPIIMARSNNSICLTLYLSLTPYFLSHFSFTGILAELEEISLHQLHIEKIELIGWSKLCTGSCSLSNLQLY